MATTIDVPTVLRLAVCLFPKVTTLDYQGPIELLSFISLDNLAVLKDTYFKEIGLPKYAIEATYLAENLDPIKPVSGPSVHPEKTYQDAIRDHYDIILVPGGSGAEPQFISQALLNFLKEKAPSAKYVLSVCTGSWILAKAGILDHQNATSNKATMKEIKIDTANQPITWVDKARWVVNKDKDGHPKLWTGSGVTAGMDLANAFLNHLLEGSKHLQIILGVLELMTHEQGDDPFANYWGLCEC